MGLIERCARALAVACDGSDAEWKQLQGAARIAISTLNVPTEEMIESARSAVEQSYTALYPGRSPLDEEQRREGRMLVRAALHGAVKCALTEPDAQ